MENILSIIAVSVLLHIFLKFVSGSVPYSTKFDNGLMVCVQAILRWFEFNICSTCGSERVMFLPDSTQPCWSLLASMKKGFDSAPKPCKKNGPGCQFYHGWTKDKPCAQAELLRTLYSAERTIYLCMFAFTNVNLSYCLKYLKSERKIDIFILTNDHQQRGQENDQIPGLVEAGFKVRVNPEASMHNKYCIVDKRIMVSGSSNWTHAAFNHNDEMITWIENPKIVREVSQKFARCYNAGKPKE